MRPAGAASAVRLKPAGRPIAKGKLFGTMEAGKYASPLKVPLVLVWLGEIDERGDSNSRLAAGKQWHCRYATFVSLEAFKIILERPGRPIKIRPSQGVLALL